MDALRQILNDMRREMRQNFADISNNITELRTDFASLKTELLDLSLSVASLDKDVQDIKDEIIPSLHDQLQGEINGLKKQRLASELYSKKSNLLFHGIPESSDEDCDLTLRTFLKNELKYNTDTLILANVHRLPTKQDNRNNGKPKPIIVKFVLMKDRDAILARAGALKNATRKYGISPHLLREMQQQRSQLLAPKRQAIAEGKRAFIKTIGTEVKLFIDNRPWSP
jgi:hypothetical protein